MPILKGRNMILYICELLEELNTKIEVNEKEAIKYDLDHDYEPLVQAGFKGKADAYRDILNMIEGN